MQGNTEPTHRGLLNSPQQVPALVNVLIVLKLAARVQLGVVVQQLDLTRLQHVVQAQFITGGELIEQLTKAKEKTADSTDSKPMLRARSSAMCDAGRGVHVSREGFKLRLPKQWLLGSASC